MFGVRVLFGIVLIIGLAACGGGSDGDLAGGNQSPRSQQEPSAEGGDLDDGTDSGAPKGDSRVSYLPLAVFEPFKAFSGQEQDDTFRGLLDYDAMIKMYLINPVDAMTLEPVQGVVAEDYVTTVDGQLIDRYESFPLLQRVIGSETALNTALVFDLSGSVVGEGADLAALVAEAKAYLAQVRDHPDPTIRNQQFAIWAFAEKVLPLTVTFTAEPEVLNQALDSVVALYQTQALGVGSNLHGAIVRVIGRYQDENSDLDFSNEKLKAEYWPDAEDDFEVYLNLVDDAKLSGMQLTQIAIFSSGPDSMAEFGKEPGMQLMKDAIHSQSLVKYKSGGADAEEPTVLLPKPVFYYVIGGAAEGTVYQPLRDEAEATVALTLSGTAGYSFSDSLPQQQLAAVERRINRGNQYLYRFAFLPRYGKEHRVEFTSNSMGYNYLLYSDFDEEFMETLEDKKSAAEELYSLVEITGPNGEYIAGGHITLGEANTFAVATRWTNLTYGPADYGWQISNGSGRSNADGTFTVDSVDGVATLSVTNLIRQESALIYISD